MKAILGKKIGMSQIWIGEKVAPVTLLEAGPCVVLQVKTKESDGYEALQVGYEQNKKNTKKTAKGKAFRYVKEFRVTPPNNDVHQAGDELNAALFQEGDKVKISGISKGKGFQGAVKRWGFHGRNSTHGTKHEERTIGSTGGRFPQRVIPGRHMPGRMGSDRITLSRAKIVKVDAEKNIIAVIGAVPGRRGTLLEIRGT
ncbi:MAG: 50S ribosomal protein L3 [Candidatus Wildermuthbacteria bacterium]|nr:50S ribosomal protein L3 [Candidatus Wildermuthbacteria bacterium]